MSKQVLDSFTCLFPLLSMQKASIQRRIEVRDFSDVICYRRGSRRACYQAMLAGN